MAAATITILMRWCVAVTASCRWTCTCPGVRRLRRRWCTASSSCRRKSPAPAPSPAERLRSGVEVSERIEALAQKVDAQLPGKLRRTAALAHELAYETEAPALL